MAFLINTAYYYHIYVNFHQYKLRECFFTDINLCTVFILGRRKLAFTLAQTNRIVKWTCKICNTVWSMYYCLCSTQCCVRDRDDLLYGLDRAVFTNSFVRTYHFPYN